MVPEVIVVLAFLMLALLTKPLRIAWRKTIHVMVYICVGKRDDLCSVAGWF